MFDHKHYVPVLRWKRAERAALSELNKGIYEQITPLVELTPWAFSDGKAKKPKTLEQKLSNITDEILQNWGQDPIFVDLWHVPADTAIVGSDHIFIRLGAEARSRQLDLIPVIGLERGRTYQTAVESLNAVDRRGVSFRICLNDLQRPSVAVEIQNLLHQLMLPPERVDLIVDYGFVNDTTLNLENLFAKIPNLQRWRTFIALGGAFPKDLSSFQPGVKRLPRLDWKIWSEFVQTHSGETRLPTFGDYTIQHANFSEPVDFPSVSASIRYTAQEYWVIMRGESVYKDDAPGFAQWPANAQLLCEQPEFCGANYSKGDDYIEKTGQQIERTGNAETWLKAGFSHHMTFVVNQIANLFGLLTADKHEHEATLLALPR